MYYENTVNVSFYGMNSSPIYRIKFSSISYLVIVCLRRLLKQKVDLKSVAVGCLVKGFFSLSWISRREWDIFSLQPLVSAKTFIDSLFNCLCLLAVKFFCSYIPFSM